MRVGVVSFWFRIFIFVLADGIRDRLAHVPSLRTRGGDDRGHLRVDFGFGSGCFSFAIHSRKFGMKFPKIFLNHLIFLTAAGSARIGTGVQRRLEGASDVQQMRALPPGPQRLFRNFSCGAAVIV